MHFRSNELRGLEPFIGGWTWQSFGQYLDAIDIGLGVNMMPLVGHNPLRLGAMDKAAWDTAGNAKGAAVDAHLYAGYVYDYYKMKFGRKAVADPLGFSKNALEARRKRCRYSNSLVCR